MKEMKPAENHFDMVMYERPSANVRVELEVNKPYTTADTLYLGDLRNRSYLKMAGPFTGGTVYTAMGYHPINMSHPVTTEYISYRMNKAGNTQYIPFKLTDYGCSGMNTVRLTVE